MEGLMSSMTIAILPEICLLILTASLFVVDVAVKKNKSQWLTWGSFLGLLLTIVLCIAFMPDLEGSPQLLWGDLVRLDAAGSVFNILLLSGAALTVLFAMRSEELSSHGEFFLLLLVSTFGMCLMVSSADMILLFLAVETASIPLYILAGFLRKDQRSIEAGVKYMLFGGVASAIMLYGFTLLYGFSGTTHLYELAGLFHAEGVPPAALIAGLVLVVAGFGFKVSSVPFHFWAPDVYEGSPTPISGFLSTASKAAGFAILMRFLISVFPQFTTVYTIILAVMAVGSMVIGNIVAISQKNLKRLLAYSSIAQAGYMLIGVAAHSFLGISGTIYYLMAYLVTNLAAFGIIEITCKEVGSDDLAAFRGLSRRSPGLALAMLVAVLSLGGIPPFAGFVGKLLVFTAAIEQGMTWLAFVGIVNAIIGLYYYLTILKVIYLYRSEGDEQPLPLSWNWGVAISICVLGMIILGTIVAPWYQFASHAATALLSY